MLGDGFTNIVFVNRAKMFCQAVRKTSSSLTDTQHDVCGDARKTLLDNVFRFKIGNTRVDPEESTGAAMGSEARKYLREAD